MSAANNWPRVRLGDVCEIVLGGTPKTSEKSYWNGDIPWLTPGEMGKIRGPYVNDTRRKLTANGLAAGSRLFPARSVILSTRAPIGYVFINQVPMCTNQGCKTIVPAPELWPEYLYFNLMGRTDELNQLGTGTTFKELATGALKGIEFPLPPLPVQREIVARLEMELGQVDQLAKKFADLETAAEAEFKATLKETFDALGNGTNGTDGTNGTRRSVADVSVADVTDVSAVPSTATRWVRLGEVFDFIDYRGKTPTKISAGVPLITAKNIRRGYLDYSERYYISEEEYATRQTRGIAHKGDLLFTTEAPMGYVAVADLDRYSTGQRVIAFQWPDENRCHDNRYFLYYFLSDVFQKQLKDNASGATAQGIKASRLVNLIVAIPHLPTQRAIVARLDAAKARKEALVDAAKRGAAEAALMRKAILKEAFE